MLYTNQILFCQACGDKFNYKPMASWGGRACCYACHREIEWREILSNLGKEYYEHPEKDSWEKHFMNNESLKIV